MDQVVDATNLSMHALQACNLVEQVSVDEVVTEPLVKPFVAFSPLHKGISNLLTGHLARRVPLVAWCAARGSAFVEGRVRRASDHLIGERRCLTPAVYVDNVPQILNGGVHLQHNCRVARAQELMASSLTGHETRNDDKHLRVEFGVLFRKWVVFLRPESIGWRHSECAQVLDFVDSPDLLFVLLHIVWLPQRFWSTKGIVAGRRSRPTLCGLRIVLVTSIVGTTIVGTIFVGVIVIFFFEVGIGLVRSSGSLRFGGVGQP